MKDLRRYLVLKYIQYLVLSSSNAISTFLGLLGSAYTLLTLRSAKVSSKSTTVLISSLAKADALVSIPLVWRALAWSWGLGDPSPALLRNLLTANAHASCLLLSCVALEAYLITFFPARSRRLRTVSGARRAAGAVWVLVTAECGLLLLDDLLRAGGVSAAARSPCPRCFQLASGAAALLRSLSYLLGILLRITNVYIYYKIFFSVSHR
ncbi:GP183 protein, partial [Alcedo cyanopectus]|nr:GP183 protein [Ceyx cyanopectus]